MKIIVDTDSYAGNFAREMCAYATSLVDECEVDEVDSTHEFAKWWSDNVIYIRDENGFDSPVEITTTPGFINDGMGGHYKDTPANRKLAVKNGVDKLIAYHEPRRIIIQKRIDENNFEEDNDGRGWTHEACLRELQQIQNHIDITRKKELFDPAYQSIKIHVNTPPPGIVMIDFESRVHEFAKQHNMQILGVRIEK